MRVDHVLTPIHLSDLPAILTSGHHTATGMLLAPDVAALAHAHLALEHGVQAGWLKGVWNNNLGNVDAEWAEWTDPSVTWFVTVQECEGPACQWRAVHRRRAFTDPLDGAAYYWRSLRERYSNAYYAMPDGAEAFCAELKSAHYFTGDAAAYARALTSIARGAPDGGG